MRFIVRSRPWRVGSVLGATLLAATLTIVPPAAAYTLKTPGGCTETRWERQPRLLLHTSEFTDGSDSLMLQAIRDVVDQFNLVGGTDARVTTVGESTAAFVFGDWFDDANPTIHVGLTTDDNIAGEELTQPPGADCEYDESHIHFNVTDTAWNFGTPGDDYYQAPESDGVGRLFRPVFLHELLHAFGLVHTSSTYSYLNAGNRPWANRPMDEAIRPLPDEIRALRHLYPADDPRTEIAVLNTWFNQDNLTDGAIPAARQELLCQPSRGKDFTSMFDELCGTGGEHATEVCDGQNLRARFAVANYSTTPVDVVAQLWFSYDDQFDWGAPDVASSSYYAFRLNAAQSAQKGYTWEVPDISEVPGTPYHTLLRVVAVPDGDPEDVTTAVTSDWIPLRGTVEIC